MITMFIHVNRNNSIFTCRMLNTHRSLDVIPTWMILVLERAGSRTPASTLLTTVPLLRSSPYWNRCRFSGLVCTQPLPPFPFRHTPGKAIFGPFRAAPGRQYQGPSEPRQAGSIRDLALHYHMVSGFWAHLTA